MLWSTRDRPRALLANLLLERSVRSAGMHVGRVRGLRDVSVQLVRRDQLALTLVPGV